MQGVLEVVGYEVLIAHDGNQALALAERLRPDLMVLELVLPKRSGISVLEKLSPQRRMPVIVTTTIATGKLRRHATDLGIQDYFCKPFVMSHLLAAVERLTQFETPWICPRTTCSHLRNPPWTPRIQTPDSWSSRPPRVLF